MRYLEGELATLRHMNASMKLATLLVAAVAVLCLAAGPAMATEEPAVPAEGEGDQRIELAETPRDRLGLILLGVIVVGGGLAVVNARRQLRGEREQATGEFRWR